MKSGGICYAVFDGLGGECFGEHASFAAARQLQQTERALSDYFIPARKYLLRLVDQLNDAVLLAQKEKMTEHMASTMTALYFTGRHVYSCNVGDSRAYRLREGELLQISTDHVEKRPGAGDKKGPLKQYLGIDTEELLLEPSIAKGELQRGDMYLLCSDGLTDMLTNFEIIDIMLKNPDVESCAQKLLDAALEHGGRDNVTIIVCSVA